MTAENFDWRSLPIVDQMQHLLHTGEFSDCTFLVGQCEQQQQRISAHRFPLCRASAVFQAMFAGGLQEKGEVKVTDVDPETFRAMLQYIYTEEVNFHDVEMTLRVMLAANKYLVTPLLNQCIHVVLKQMQARDVWKVLDVGNLLDNLQLQEAALKILQEQTYEVLNSTSWVEASSTFVLTLLQQDTLNVDSEVPLLIACERWSQHQVNNDDKLTVRELFDPFLPYLRLRTLTAEQFVQATAEDQGVFTAEESRQILRCIVIPELKMPSGFCEMNNSRIIPHRSTAKTVNLVSMINAAIKSDSMETLELPAVSLTTENTKQFKSSLILISSSHVLLYGVKYTPLTISQVDVFESLTNNGEYDESFTVELIDQKTSTCVQSLNYQGKIKYSSNVGEGEIILYFTHQYLMNNCTRLEVKVTYTGVGYRQFYGYGSDHCAATLLGLKVKDFYVQPGTGVFGINQIIYKKVQ